MADSKHTLTIKLQEIEFPRKDDPRHAGKFDADDQPISTFSEQMKDLHKRAREARSESEAAGSPMSYRDAFSQVTRRPTAEPIIPTSMGFLPPAEEPDQQVFTLPEEQEAVPQGGRDRRGDPKWRDVMPTQTSGISAALDFIKKAITTPLRKLQPSKGDIGGGGGNGGAPVGGSLGGDSPFASDFIDSIYDSIDGLKIFTDFLNAASEEIKMYSPELIMEEVKTTIALMEARIGRAGSGEAGALAMFQESQRGLLVEFEETKSILSQTFAPMLAVVVDILSFCLGIINTILDFLRLALGTIIKALADFLEFLDDWTGLVPDNWHQSLHKTADAILAQSVKSNTKKQDFVAATLAGWISNPNYAAGIVTGQISGPPNIIP